MEKRKRELDPSKHYSEESKRSRPDNQSTSRSSNPDKKTDHNGESTDCRIQEHMKGGNATDNTTEEYLKNNYKLIKYISYTPEYFQKFQQKVMDIIQNKKSINDNELKQVALDKIMQQKEHISNEIECSLKRLQKFFGGHNSNTGKENERVIRELLIDENKTLRQAAQDSLPILDKQINEVTLIRSLDTEKLQDSLPIRRALTDALKFVSNIHEQLQSNSYSYKDVNEKLSDKYIKLEQLEKIRKKIVNAIKAAKSDNDRENLRKWENHLTNIIYSRLLDLEDTNKPFTKKQLNMNSRAVIYDDSHPEGKITTKLYFPGIDLTTEKNAKIWGKISFDFAMQNLTEIAGRWINLETRRTKNDAEVKTLHDLYIYLESVSIGPSSR